MSSTRKMSELPSLAKAFNWRPGVEAAAAEVARCEVARREAAEAVQREAAEAVQFGAAEAVEAAAAVAAAEAADPAGFGRLWAGSLSANNGRTQPDENTIVRDIRIGSKAGMR